MRSIILIFIMSAVLAATCFASDLPKTIVVEDSPLILNGEGKRTKMLVNIYKAGLYLESETQKAENILSKEHKMNMRLLVLSELVTAKKMEKAILKGFKKSTNDNTAPISEEIEVFLSIIRKDKVIEGDVFDMTYIPGRGTELYKNGKKYTTIKGSQFKSALYGIWIGENPAQKSLKKRLLAQH